MPDGAFGKVICFSVFSFFGGVLLAKNSFIEDILSLTSLIPASSMKGADFLSVLIVAFL